VITLTLGHMLDDGYTLHGTCRACGKSKKINLRDACERLGRDHQPNIRGKLRCQCGSRAIDLSLGGPHGTKPKD